MRKYIVIVLGILLLLSLTALAYAEQPDVKLGGRILVRGWYFDNVGSVMFDDWKITNLPVKTKYQALYTTNAYITIDAKVAEGVRGFMELETTVVGTKKDVDLGVEKPNTGLYIWGGGADTKPAGELYFRQLWIQYTGSGLLGVPAGIKAGHQLLTLGEKQFLNHERFGDDAILLLVDPTKELHLAVGTAKLWEGEWTKHKDDIDAYILLGTYKLDKDNTVGLNYTLIHSDSLINKEVLAAIPADESPVSVDTLNLQNLGLHANGKVEGLSYAGEVDIQFGKVKGDGEVSKFRGYGIFAKLGYKVDPVNLRASFALGSGDDDYDNKIEEFVTLQGPEAVGPLARFVHYTQIYERTILTAAGYRNAGIANTTYYNAGLDITPVKELSLSLDGYILRATKKLYDCQSKNVGTEVDFKGTYKIAKNLSYFVEAGVFTPGKFYNFVEEGIGAPKKKTVTQAVHGLNLTF
ncbi:MAG: hypothetical protein QMC83_09435 [Thermodesulfovibrionales bacterium]|nr:hypothetical protein [Thermodesulfovibrionales bacterium]